MHKHCVETQKKKSSLKGHTAKVREMPRVRPARAPRQCPRLTPAAVCPARGSPLPTLRRARVRGAFHQPRGPCVTRKDGEIRAHQMPPSPRKGCGASV